jgi:hypothetical protein
MARCRRLGVALARLCGRRPALAGSLRLAFAGGLIATTLAGCATGDGIGAFIVDPAQYAAYHCKDLVAAEAGLKKRQKDLRDLMDKAGSGFGTVVSAMAYRDQYIQVLQQEKLVRRAQAQQKCLPPPAVRPVYRSDQMIH